MDPQSWQVMLRRRESPERHLRKLLVTISKMPTSFETFVECKRQKSFGEIEIDGDHWEASLGNAAQPIIRMSSDKKWSVVSL